jgi:thiol-disulfide isomerase/thioredoxin
VTDGSSGDCRRAHLRRYGRAVASRRLPLSVIVAATALALVAALGVLTLLDGGDDGDASADGTAEGYELTPAGELPGSVAEVRLGSLAGGDDRALGELLGTTPVVVNFFGSWCVPCIEEMPAFERVHQVLGDRVAFVGMSNRERSPEDALAIVESTGVTYPTFDDPDASALTYFGGLGMPTTVFIDVAGNVVDVHTGPLTEAELQAKITDLFGIAA